MASSPFMQGIDDEIRNMTGMDGLAALAGASPSGPVNPTTPNTGDPYAGLYPDQSSTSQPGVWHGLPAPWVNGPNDYSAHADPLPPATPAPSLASVAPTPSPFNAEAAELETLTTGRVPDGLNVVVTSSPNGSRSAEIMPTDMASARALQGGGSVSIIGDPEQGAMILSDVRGQSALPEAQPGGAAQPVDLAAVNEPALPVVGPGATAYRDPAPDGVPGGPYTQPLFQDPVVGDDAGRDGPTLQPVPSGPDALPSAQPGAAPVATDLASVSPAPLLPLTTVGDDPNRDEPWQDPNGTWSAPPVADPRAEENRLRIETYQAQQDIPMGDGDFWGMTPREYQDLLVRADTADQTPTTGGNHRTIGGPEVRANVDAALVEAGGVPLTDEEWLAFSRPVAMPLDVAPARNGPAPQSADRWFNATVNARLARIVATRDGQDTGAVDWMMQTIGSGLGLLEAGGNVIGKPQSLQNEYTGEWGYKLIYDSLPPDQQALYPKPKDNFGMDVISAMQGGHDGTLIDWIQGGVNHIPGVDTGQFDSWVSDPANAQTILSVYTNGYDYNGDGVADFTGGQALHEYYAGGQNRFNRLLNDLFYDPVNAGVILGGVGTGIRGLGTGIRAAGSGPVRQVVGRGVELLGHGVALPNTVANDIPDRIIGGALGYVGRGTAEMYPELGRRWNTARRPGTWFQRTPAGTLDEAIPEVGGDIDQRQAVRGQMAESTLPDNPIAATAARNQPTPLTRPNGEIDALDPGLTPADQASQYEPLGNPGFASTPVGDGLGPTPLLNGEVSPSGIQEHPTAGMVDILGDTVDLWEALRDPDILVRKEAQRQAGLPVEDQSQVISTTGLRNTLRPGRRSSVQAFYDRIMNRDTVTTQGPVIKRRRADAQRGEADATRAVEDRAYVNEGRQEIAESRRNEESARRRAAQSPRSGATQLAIPGLNVPEGTSIVGSLPRPTPDHPLAVVDAVPGPKQISIPPTLQVIAENTIPIPRANDGTHLGLLEAHDPRQADSIRETYKSLVALAHSRRADVSERFPVVNNEFHNKNSSGLARDLADILHEAEVRGVLDSMDMTTRATLQKLGVEIPDDLIRTASNQLASDAARIQRTATKGLINGPTIDRARLLVNQVILGDLDDPTIQSAWTELTQILDARAAGSYRVAPNLIPDIYKAIYETKAVRVVGGLDKTPAANSIFYDMGSRANASIEAPPPQVEGAAGLAPDPDAPRPRPYNPVHRGPRSLRRPRSAPDDIDVAPATSEGRPQLPVDDLNDIYREMLDAVQQAEDALDQNVGAPARVIQRLSEELETARREADQARQMLVDAGGNPGDGDVIPEPVALDPDPVTPEDSTSDATDDDFDDVGGEYYGTEDEDGLIHPESPDHTNGQATNAFAQFDELTRDLADIDPGIPFKGADGQKDAIKQAFASYKQSVSKAITAMRRVKVSELTPEQAGETAEALREYRENVGWDAYGSASESLSTEVIDEVSRYQSQKWFIKAIGDSYTQADILLKKLDDRAAEASPMDSAAHPDGYPAMAVPRHEVDANDPYSEEPLLLSNQDESAIQPGMVDLTPYTSNDSEIPLSAIPDAGDRGSEWWSIDKAGLKKWDYQGINRKVSELRQRREVSDIARTMDALSRKYPNFFRYYSAKHGGHGLVVELHGDLGSGFNGTASYKVGGNYGTRHPVTGAPIIKTLSPRTVPHEVGHMIYDHLDKIPDRTIIMHNGHSVGTPKAIVMAWLKKNASSGSDRWKRATGSNYADQYFTPESRKKFSKEGDRAENELFAEVFDQSTGVYGSGVSMPGGRRFAALLDTVFDQSKWEAQTVNGNPNRLTPDGQAALDELIGEPVTPFFPNEPALPAPRDRQPIETIVLDTPDDQLPMSAVRKNYEDGDGVYRLSLEYAKITDPAVIRDAVQQVDDEIDDILAFSPNNQRNREAEEQIFVMGRGKAKPTLDDVELSNTLVALRIERDILATRYGQLTNLKSLTQSIKTTAAQVMNNTFAPMNGVVGPGYNQARDINEHIAMLRQGSVDAVQDKALQFRAWLGQTAIPQDPATFVPDPTTGARPTTGLTNAQALNLDIEPSAGWSLKAAEAATRGQSVLTVSRKGEAINSLMVPLHQTPDADWNGMRIGDIYDTARQEIEELHDLTARAQARRDGARQRVDDNEVRRDAERTVRLQEQEAERLRRQAGGPQPRRTPEQREVERQARAARVEAEYQRKRGNRIEARGLARRDQDRLKYLKTKYKDHFQSVDANNPAFINVATASDTSAKSLVNDQMMKDLGIDPNGKSWSQNKGVPQMMANTVNGWIHWSNYLTMVSPDKIGRRYVQDALNNPLNMIQAGEWQAAFRSIGDSLRPAKTWRNIKQNDYESAMQTGAGRRRIALGISDRNDPEYTRVSNKRAADDAADHIMNSKVIKGSPKLTGIMETQKRMFQVNDTLGRQNLAEVVYERETPKLHIGTRSALYDEAKRANLWTRETPDLATLQQWTDQFYRQRPDGYSATDIYQFVRNQFASAPDQEAAHRMAERVARRHQAGVNIIENKAKAKVKEVLFSFRDTPADQLLRKVFMAHFYQTRALKFYAQNAVKNPMLINLWYEGYEAMQREAENGDYPPGMRGVIQLWGTPFGLTAFMNPNSFTDFWGGAEIYADQNGERSAFDQLINMPFAPGANIPIRTLLDLAGQTSNRNMTNPLGISSTEQALFSYGDLVKWYAAGLGIPGAGTQEDFDFGATGDDGQQYLNNLRAWTTSWIPGATERESADVNATQQVELAAMIVERAQREWNTPIAAMTQSQIDQLFGSTAPDGTRTMGIVNNPDHPWYQQSVRTMLGSNATEETIQDTLLSGFQLQGTARIEGQITAAGDRDTEGTSGVLQGLQDQVTGSTVAPLISPDGTVTPRSSEETRTAADQQEDTNRVLNAPEGTSRDLQIQMNERADAGTPEGREVTNRWNTIAYGDLSEVPELSVNGQPIPANLIVGMSQDDRIRLADGDLRVNGTQQQYDAQKQAYATFDADHPQVQAFNDWKSSIRKYTSANGQTGPAAYWSDIARTNPSIAWYYQDQKKKLDRGEISQDRYEANLISGDAYLLTIGERPSVFDPSPSSRLYAPLSAATSGSGSTGFGGSSTPANPRDQIEEDIADYEAQDAQFRAATGLQDSFLTLHPLVQQMYTAYAAQSGIEPPHMGSAGDQYLDWALEQGEGDSTVEAYISWMDQQHQESDARLADWRSRSNLSDPTETRNLALDYYLRP